MDTTYEHPGNVTTMYAAREQFRHLTKMVCDFVKVNKIDHFGNVIVMVRNAGQLPQPFWLGAARGGGSCSAARCAARA
nr:MAG TPA: hypothetical protein [Caudoviricetes sp.]